MPTHSSLMPINHVLVYRSLTQQTIVQITFYVSPNPEQPLSRAEDCEQFCYRGRGDNSRAVFTVIDHITQTLHYSNVQT